MEFEFFPKPKKELMPIAGSEERTAAEKAEAEAKREPAWAGEEQEKERSEAAKRLGLPGRPSWGEINAAEAAAREKKE